MEKILIFFVFLICLSTSCKAFVCEGEGFFPDPTDCAKFYRCVTGTKYSFDCGPGTHFNPNCDCCDWPYNVNCQASGAGGGSSRYENPNTQTNGQGYGQQSGGQQSGGQFRQYGQQPSSQSGQDLNQNYWQQSGQSSAQNGQRGQSLEDIYQQYWQQSGQQPQQQSRQEPQYPSVQSGQQPGAQSGQGYWQQPSGQSGQANDNYGQQPSNNQYGEYGQPSGRRHSQSQRQPQESQQIDSRLQSPDNDDRSPNQRPNRVYGRRQQKQQPKTDPRQQSLDETEDIYEEPKSIRRERPKPRPQPKTDTRQQSLDDSDDIYEEPKTSRRERPKPRPQPKPNRREDPDLDEDFDHKFDEPIEERRAKPKPRPQPQNRRIIPQTEEPDEYEDVEVLTTSRPRVPKRRHRVRIPTTTEAEESTEDSYNEFSQFENDIQDKEDEEVNKWLQIEDSEPKTTTEDPYVSMLKERIPSQSRNRSRINRNRQHSGTTPHSVRQRVEVTTVDPYDEEWADFIAGNSEPNREQLPTKSKTDDKHKKKSPKEKVKPKMENVMRYFNCTEAGKSCDECEELDWVQFPRSGLNSTPFRSYKFLPTIASKQCYKACSESQQCIAFSYSPIHGMCHIYNHLTVEDIVVNKEYNTVIKNPKNGVVNDEWVHTKNGLMKGKELYSVRTDSVWDCLKECVNDMEYCMAVDFDLVESKCRVFDAYDGYAVNTVKANTISLQHLSVFEDNDEWRFEEKGHKTLANSQPIETKPVKDSEECFYECMENPNNNCSFVTIEEKKSVNEESNEEDVDQSSTKLCHLFPFNSSPKWIKSRDKSNTSYVMSVPKNHSKVQTYPGYAYIGNPVETKEGLTEEECIVYAEENCRFCRKYTYVIETKECAIFSDSALLSPAYKYINYTEKSGLLSIPKDSEYMAFKRIPWKMFVTDVSPYELKGEINGQKCLQFCLQQKSCVSTALVYDTTHSSMFCYFFKESDLRNSNITEYENVDLFIKIMDQDEMPGQLSNKTDECSDGRPLDSALKNINELKSNSTEESGEYNYPLSPHGGDYYDNEEELNSNPSDDRNSRKTILRSQRSVNRNRRLELDENELDSELNPKNKRGKRDDSEQPLKFIENVRQNARKRNILDRISTLLAELSKKVEQNIKSESLKSSDEDRTQNRNRETNSNLRHRNVDRKDRLSEDCDNENEFTFDFNNRCNDRNEVKNETEMCSQLPKIIYSDQQLMQSCNETLVGEECTVVCRPGYEPTEEKIKCQKSGHRNVWKHSKQIKCKPIENECEIVDKRDDKYIRIKAITKYPEERLHFFTRFDTKRKLPQFSAYVHTKDNTLNNSIQTSDESIEYLKNSCEELDDKQIKTSDYRESNYIPKPLLPRNAFIYSNRAQGLLNTMTNTAPQDVFTSGGPWRILENRTLEMLKSRPGIVISGVCPQSIAKSDVRHQRNRKNLSKNLEIPQCFWSIYCVPFGEGVTTGVFYAENSNPVSQLDKQKRVDQIRQYRDQRFIVKLLGTDLYKTVWIETYNAFKDFNKGIKTFIYKCAETDRNSAEGITFWQNVITGEDNVEDWPSKFKYGIENSESLNKKKTTTRNEERIGDQFSDRR